MKGKTHRRNSLKSGVSLEKQEKLRSFEMGDEETSVGATAAAAEGRGDEATAVEGTDAQPTSGRGKENTVKLRPPAGEVRGR